MTYMKNLLILLFLFTAVLNSIANANSIPKVTPEKDLYESKYEKNGIASFSINGNEWEFHKIYSKIFNHNIWSKLIFTSPKGDEELFQSNDNQSDLSEGIAFSNIDSITEHLSPDNQYTIINELEYGIVKISDKEQTYSEQNYCSFVSTKTGCVIARLSDTQCIGKWSKEETGVFINDYDADNPIVFDFKMIDLDNNKDILEEQGGQKNFERCKILFSDNAN